MLKASLKKRIFEKLKALVKQGAAPGFQLVLGFKDQTLGSFSVGNADLQKFRRLRDNTWFDLASLTKILVTVDLIIRSLQSKQIADLDQPLKTWFPFLSSELKNISLAEVLNHRSGLPPIFEYSREVGADLPSREDRVRFFLRKVDETYLPPVAEKKVVYSDVGFMLLGMVLEQIHGKRLRQIVTYSQNLAFGPIRFKAEFLSWLFQNSTVAASLSLESKTKWLKGVVQDPRAQWLMGDAGHAGLFGTAMGIEEWGRELYMGYQGKSTIYSDKVLRSFLQFENKSGSYINGFDTPSTEGVSQAGSHWGPQTVGHLGYTGPSYWTDLEKGYRVTLLCSRFQLGANSEILRTLRPAFHDWLCLEVFSKIKI